MRTVFVDPENQLAYVCFKCDAFCLVIQVEDTKMVVSCHSATHRMDLVKKIINFNVFAELRWLENPESRQIEDSNLHLINFVTSNDNQLEGVYLEESSIQNLQEANLIETP